MTKLRMDYAIYSDKAVPANIFSPALETQFIHVTQQIGFSYIRIAESFVTSEGFQNG